VLSTLDPTEEERALLDVVRTLRRFPAAHALVSVVSVLHLWGAVTLLLAPDNQLFTQGTRPVFALFPPLVWAVAFAVGGLASASLLLRVTVPRQLVAWFTVLPSQTVWIAASVIAVLSGAGSAMGIVFLTAVLAFTTITAIVVAVDFTTGKR
jgi:hypothetical protein